MYTLYSTGIPIIYYGTEQGTFFEFGEINNLKDLMVVTIQITVKYYGQLLTTTKPFYMKYLIIFICGNVLLVFTIGDKLP